MMQQTAIEVLERRYPEIFFLRHFTFFEKWVLAQKEGCFNARRKEESVYTDLGKELQAFLKNFDEVHTEVVYLYGLGLGYHIDAIFPWLEKDPTRAIVVFEEDISVIDAFLHMHWAEAFLSHPRVHLRLVKDQEEIVQEAKFFPAGKVQFFKVASYKKKNFKKVSLALKRKTIAEHASWVECLYPHLLLGNLSQNFLRVPSSFFVNSWQGQCKNIPAIICGAGPSLSLSLPKLRGVKDRALIFAGGSTIAALSNQGVLPHLGMALDPNTAEYIRLKNSCAFEVPLLYGSRLLPDVFNVSSNPPGYMLSHTGGPLETWFEKAIGLEGEPIGHGLGKEAFSVTTLAVSLACFMGCNPIIFCGVDLAFTGGDVYAGGVLPDSKKVMKEWKSEKSLENEVLLCKDRFGKDVTTLLKWIMEADTIGRYASNHPGTDFFNCSEGGIPIPGIEYLAFEEAEQRYLSKMLDIEGMCHLFMQSTRIDPGSSKASQALEEFADSVKRCLVFCREMIEEVEGFAKRPSELLESGRMIHLKEMIGSEIAYQHYLFTLSPSIKRWFHRAYLGKDDPDYRNKMLEREIATWQSCQRSLEEAIKLIR